MPELPEVETIRRQLAPKAASKTIVEAQVLDPRWCAPVPPGEVEEMLRGRRIETVHRRGKYLMMELDSERFLVMHLRMTGNLLWRAFKPREHAGRGSLEAIPHLRVRLVLDSGDEILFADLRRFGTGVVIDGRESLERYLEIRLGPEPLDPSFTADVLRRQTAGRKAPVKAFLLDQRRVAGIGNIYADEALFRAQIHPLRPAGRLRRAEVERLRDGIVEALLAGIESFGASIDRYRDADGARGSMQERFLVHRREGSPCPRCGGPIVKVRAAGRGTYVCPRCQRAPRLRRPIALRGS
jgi:formamidopyrimidine-DNA glycosylase